MAVPCKKRGSCAVGKGLPLLAHPDRGAGSTGTSLSVGSAKPGCEMLSPGVKCSARSRACGTFDSFPGSARHPPACPGALLEKGQPRGWRGACAVCPSPLCPALPLAMPVSPVCWAHAHPHNLCCLLRSQWGGRCLQRGFSLLPSLTALQKRGVTSHTGKEDPHPDAKHCGVPGGY